MFEQQLQLSNNENEKLKHDFHQSEKDKLEAQTRLEVLSNYFKEKETQLQKYAKTIVAHTKFITFLFLLTEN